MFNSFFNFEKIFDTFNYVLCFFLLNLFFMLFNIPLILFIVFLGISNILNYFPLFLICLLPTMPTLTILFYCMNKLFKNKDVNVMKDFFNGFKLNFKQSFFIWLIELVVILMLYFNIRFFSVIKYNLPLVCLFYLISLILLATTPFIFILISKFKMKSNDILKTSFILCFTRPILTITNLLLFVTILIFFEIAPGITILFIASLLSFALVYVNKSLLKDLEILSEEQNLAQ